VRVALYARVSTKQVKADGKEQTVENQLLDLRQHAAARGWSVIAEHTDIGISGAKDRRPGLDRLLILVQQRKVDAVAVASLDRWGRSLSHLLRSLEDMQAAGCALVSLRENLDLTTPAGRLMFAVIAALAEYERSIIRERILSGLRRVAVQGTRSGKPIGRPRTLFDRGTARALRLAGWSWSQIARHLEVSRSAVRRCVANPAPHRGERPRERVEPTHATDGAGR